MKTAIGVVAICILFARPIYADDQAPSWITKEKLAGLKTIGIDPANDIEAKGNYHWRYRAQKTVAVDVYSCPIGSTVDLSRTIDVIISPEGVPCSSAKGGNFRFLKLLPNGSAEPMP